jgi:hypothetical protein
MTIRSHRNRFWYRLPQRRVRQPRSPLHVTSTSLITTVVPISISGWLFQISRGQPNRTGLARYAIRRERRRSRQRREPRLRVTIKVQSRVFLPRRRRIQGGPFR